MNIRKEHFIFSEESGAFLTARLAVGWRVVSASLRISRFGFHTRRTTRAHDRHPACVTIDRDRLRLRQRPYYREARSLMYALITTHVKQSASAYGKVMGNSVNWMLILSFERPICSSRLVSSSSRTIMPEVIRRCRNISTAWHVALLTRIHFLFFALCGRLCAVQLTIMYSVVENDTICRRRTDQAADYRCHMTGVLGSVARGRYFFSEYSETKLATLYRI